MGQKVNPTSLRLGGITSWHSNWYSDTNSLELLHEDLQIRHYLRSVYDRNGFISGIAKIERSLSQIIINLPVTEPLNFMGEKSSKKKNIINVDVNKVREVIEQIAGLPVSLSVQTVECHESAYLLAKDFALKMESRMPFSVLLKRYIKYAISAGKINGIKIQCSGRLNGEDIARTEWVKEGEIPLHTIKADIDYGFANAYTIYGVTGIKVWICR